MSTSYVEMGARQSSDGRYRYRLWREWRSTRDSHWHWLDATDGAGQRVGWPKAAVFVMLNPSTADASSDDPTIRRCVSFAKAWRYDRIEVVNLFAHRATDPRGLLELGHDQDPVGTENQESFRRAVREAGVVVCAWGIHGKHLGQDETALGWLEECWGKSLWCLGKTKAGQPRHPLFVPSSAALVPYTGRGATA